MEKRLFLFDRTQQRILARTGEIHRLFGFHRRDLVRVKAGDAEAFVMDLEHYCECLGLVAGENVLEDEDDKFHRREIVVVENDFEELGFSSRVRVSVITSLPPSMSGNSGIVEG